VLLVIAFHLGLPGFSGGYLGVDAFFVISGYLITGILMVDIERREFSYSRFLLKRANRLLPALTVMTFVTTVGAWVLFNAAQLSRFGDSLLGVSTYVSNFIFMLDDSYFQQSAATTPLLHTWSLGVEEQFYILFPLLMLALFSLREKWLFPTALLLTALSLFAWLWFREYESSSWVSDWAFFMLPTRAWELGAGGLLALAIAGGRFERFSSRKREFLAWAGVGLLLMALTVGDRWPDRGMASVLMVLAMLSFISFSPGSKVGRLLSTPALVGVGLLSYGLYLWHYPLLALVRIYQGVEELDLWMMLLVVSGSFIFSFLSLRLVENPVRLGVFNKPRALALVVGFVALFMFMGFASKIPATVLPPEIEAAEVLRDHPWVYFTGLDERIFQRERLARSIPPGVETVVAGSSRVMSVSSDVWGGPVLNLGVSGASIEDIYALGLEGLNRTGARTIVIGLDPWIVNKASGQNRWRAIEGAYSYWESAVSDGAPLALIEAEDDSNDQSRDSLLLGIFNFVNQGDGALIPEDGFPELVAKKAQDGSIVYNLDYLDMSEEKISGGFPSILTYSNMNSFELGNEKLGQLQKLVAYLQENGVRVVLLLSPYHPDIYAEIQTSFGGFASAEIAFQVLSEETGADLLGSYDPSVPGCRADDFYDGMHPTGECMRKVLQSTF